MAFSSEQYIERIEQLRGKELNPEQRAEIDLWQKGKALAQIVGTEGWEIAQDTLNEFPKDLTEQLLSTSPADRDAVLATHAAAYAATMIIRNYRRAILEALEAAQKMPDTIKTGLKEIKTVVPPESL